MSHGDPAAADQGDGAVAAQSFALIAVGDLQIGLPSASVLHALPWPTHLTVVPRTHEALEGVFVYRDQVVPLANLRRWLNRAPEASTGQQVLMLRAGQRVLGVAVDAVQGLVQVPAGAVYRIHHDERPEELFHSVARPEGSLQPLSLLDPERLMAQLDVWATTSDAVLTQTGPANHPLPAPEPENRLNNAADSDSHLDDDADLRGNDLTGAEGTDLTGAEGTELPRTEGTELTSTKGTELPSAHSADGRSAGGPQRPQAQIASSWAVVQIGATVLACRAADVGEVLRMPALQKVFGSDSSLLGIARWRGKDVPVANILNLLGMRAGAEAASSPWMLVLGHEGRHIGMPVDEVRAVRRFDPQDIQPTAGAGLAHAELYSGLFNNGQGDVHLLLDSEAVVTRCPLHEISAVRAGSAKGPQQSAQEAEDAAQAHIVFRAGHTFAVAIRHMQEITAFPTSLVRNPDAASALWGSFDQRGRSCALWDLQALLGLGRTKVKAVTRVIVVALADNLVGLLVDELVALLPAHHGEHTRFSFGPNQNVHMISVGGDEKRLSYRVLNLAELPELNSAAAAD